MQYKYKLDGSLLTVIITHEDESVTQHGYRLNTDEVESLEKDISKADEIAIRFAAEVKQALDSQVIPEEPELSIEEKAISAQEVEDAIEAANVT